MCTRACVCVRVCVCVFVCLCVRAYICVRVLQNHRERGQQRRIYYQVTAAVKYLLCVPSLQLLYNLTKKMRLLFQFFYSTEYATVTLAQEVKLNSVRKRLIGELNDGTPWKKGSATPLLKRKLASWSYLSESEQIHYLGESM